MEYVQTYVKPGTVVYFPLYREALVVETHVRVVEDWRIDKVDKKKNAILVFTNVDGRIEIPSGESWEEVQRTTELGVQYVDIAEPIGNAIDVGYECFLTAREALACIPYSSPRHKLRRLKRARRSRVRWILSTHSICGRYGKRPQNSHPAVTELLKIYPQNPRLYTRRK